MLRILTHGGTASTRNEKDGTDASARAGLGILRGGGSPLEAVVRACAVLEDDERFNAGTGSNFLFDGARVEMDAACMDSSGRFGAVCAIREVKNPVLVARDVLEETVHCLLAGDGAVSFARCQGHGPHDPRTRRAKEKWAEVVENIRKGEASRSDCEWDLDPLRSCWNFERSYEDVLGEPRPRVGDCRVGTGDTVGAVATDGRSFAAAASTGGTITTLRGRIGDTPTIGAGVFSGSHGAVACTGNGDHPRAPRLPRPRLDGGRHGGPGGRREGQADVPRVGRLLPHRPRARRRGSGRRQPRVRVVHAGGVNQAGCPAPGFERACLCFLPPRSPSRVEVAGRMLTVVTHGGAASLSEHRDGPEEAARLAIDVLRKGGSPLEAAVEAVTRLEDDPRFNAGTGSNLRFDGKTIEMDAACMDSSGRFGAVAAIREVKNPVLVARAVMRTPHNLLAGDGATRFARSLGHPKYDPWTPRAQEKFELVRAAIRARKHTPAEAPWALEELASMWNYEVEVSELMGSRDTVGAVVGNGRSYAAALSTGGTISTLMGRVGDVPLPGCGVHAGPLGAVATTGDGDHLTRVSLASTVYRWLEQGLSPDEAVDRAIGLLAPDVDVGVIVVKGDEYAGGSNRDMAWAWAQEAA